MPTLQTETDETDDGLGKCGTWRLLREVGHGAYGVVYLAEEVEGRRAAVKVCRRDAVDAERYARELRGAKLYRSLPFSVGLVRMREVAETAWGFYSVMDLADDEFDGKGVPSESYRPKTLAKVIEGEKALPLKVCVQLGISLADCDAYVNVAGGMKINEPGLDLAIVMALLSSYRNKPVGDSTIALGEIGLTGEVRSVSMLTQRIKEAAKLGYEKCIVPAGVGEHIKNDPTFPKNIKVVEIKNIKELK